MSAAVVGDRRQFSKSCWWASWESHGLTFFAEERVVNQRRATVGHVGVDGKLGVSHVLS